MQYGYIIMKPDQPLIPFCQGEIFVDRCGDPDTPAFTELMHKLKDGDSLVIPAISCLGASLTKICEKWDQLLAGNVRVNVLDFPESVSEDRMVFRVIDYLCQSEKEIWKNRKLSGLQDPKKTKPGRKPRKIPADFETVCQEYEAEKLTCREAAFRLNVSHTTFLRWYRESR